MTERDTYPRLPPVGRPTAYLLDTSAVLAYYQGEAGSDVVRGIFEARERGEAAIFISFMTIFELAYILTSREGDREAFSFILKLRNLRMDEVWPDEDLMWRATATKALGGLSVADAFIAASAMAEQAVLVHKDPEFEALQPGLTTISLDDCKTSE